MNALEWIRLIAGSLLLFGGCFLSLTAAVGVLRMPDFFSRLHPAGKGDTLAQVLIVAGLVIQPYPQSAQSIAKLLLITGLLFLTAPTATHAITQAAYLAGLRGGAEERHPQKEGPGA